MKVASSKCPLTSAPTLMLAEDYSSRLALIIGWGRLSAKGAQPELLQQASVPVLHNDDCRSNFKYHGKEITDNMFCAGYFDGMHDACMVRKECPQNLREHPHYSIFSPVRVIVEVPL